MAFPEFSQVAEVAKEVYDGKLPRKINKEQPIDCTLM